MRTEIVFFLSDLKWNMTQYKNRKWTNLSTYDREDGKHCLMNSPSGNYHISYKKSGLIQHYGFQVLYLKAYKLLLQIVFFSLSS